ncbi:MAG: SulP family inorganic anion transporter [Candidatus Methylacidiphilales bacterium]
MKGIGLREVWGYFPFLKTARTYGRAEFRADVMASLTVALLTIPQAIAYAAIAGLPPVYGIYSAIVLTFLGSLFVNSQHLISGPTNATALVTGGALLSASHPWVLANPAEAAMVLTLMVGLVQLGFGLLKVGNLAQFISRSVLVGFSTGAGLLIALNQVPDLLGLTMPPVRQLLARFTEMFSRLGETNPYAVMIGVGSLALLMAGKKWAPRWPTALMTMALASATVWAFDLEAKGVKIAGDLPDSLPPFVPPYLNLGVIADLAGSAIAIALLGCIEGLSSAKRMSLLSGQRMNTNQDFIGLGLAQVVGSFFQCMPGGGSFVRSALNFSAGARTRFAGVFSAVWVAVIVLLVAPLAKTIPTASLAALLIYLGVGLIQPEHIRSSVLATKSDAAVLILTFLCTLFLHLDTAIYVGVLSSLILFLRKASAPHLVEYNMDDDSMREIRSPKERANPEISIVHVEGELFFGAADAFEEQVRLLAQDPNIRVIILRLKNARHLDATAAYAIAGLHDHLKKSGRLLLISGAPPEVMRVMERSGLVARLGAENVFPSEENLTVATRRALMRAKEFLGGEVSADVRIFYDKSRDKAKKAGV